MEPATRLLTVPATAETLLDAHGKIDLGPIAFSLPEELSLSLRMVTDKPLEIYLGSPYPIDFEVAVKVAGWPDSSHSPGAERMPESGDDALAQSLLEEFVSQNAPLIDVLGLYREYTATWITMQGGPCVRIRDIKVRTLIAVQACVDTVAGTHSVLKIEKNAFGGEPFAKVDIEEFWSQSQTILDTIRLGPLTSP